MASLSSSPSSSSGGGGGGGGGAGGGGTGGEGLAMAADDSSSAFAATVIDAVMASSQVNDTTASEVVEAEVDAAMALAHSEAEQPLQHDDAMDLQSQQQQQQEGGRAHDDADDDGDMEHTGNGAVRRASDDEDSEPPKKVAKVKSAIARMLEDAGDSSEDDESYKDSDDGSDGGSDSSSGSDDDSDNEERTRQQNNLRNQADAIKARMERSKTKGQTGMVYDEGMLLHKHPKEDHVESPKRILRMREHLEACGLYQQCAMIAARKALVEELSLVHTQDYLDDLRKTEQMQEEILIKEAQEKFNSIYLCSSSYSAALLAAGGVIELTEAVMAGHIRNGFALVRPPGHHAESHEAMGFCLINNVAVAVRTAQQKHNAKKVLILDWDVHHGNGIQRVFQSDPDVLYISLHRYDNASFYPHSPDADATFVGTNGAEGRTVNIPWSGRGMTDGDYLLAFEQVVMPIAHEFQPEIVIVAAGFDAAVGDPIGGCFVTPAGYSQMTYMLSSVANGRVILVLEGGYDLQALSMSAAACVSVLLGAPPEPVERAYSCDEAAVAVRRVIEIQSSYWKSLRPRVLDARRYYQVGDDHEAVNIIENRRALGTYMKDLGSVLDLHLPMQLIDAKMYHLPLKDEVPCLKLYVSATALGDVAPLLLLFHGSGYVRYVDGQPDNVLKLPSAHLAGTVIPYIETAHQDQLSIMSVHIVASAQRPNESAPSESVKAAVLRIWDDYIAFRITKPIVVVADTVGARYMSTLFAQRDVEKKIKGVVAFSQPFAPAIIPREPKDKERAQQMKEKAVWFYESSMVMLPSDLDPGTEVQLGMRFGRCYSTGPETRTEESIWTFHESAFDFLRRRIAAYSS